jgi:RimJ/RimL family protein N-acetyltransferase
LALRQFTFWVWEEEGTIQGFSAADPRDGSICALFVHPLYERRGIGRALLPLACDVLKESGRASAVLTTEAGTRAERFYRTDGWTEVGRKENRQIIFQKNLLSSLQNIVLISERLTLRSFAEHDAGESFAFATPTLTRFMAWDPSPSPAAFAHIWRGWLPKIAAGADLALVVRVKTGEFLGMAGLHGIGGAEPEIGIWIKEAAHGAGYGREAVATIIAWACRCVGATAFTYPVAVENLPSRRLAESIGGKVTGVRKLRKPSGVVLDQVVYRIVQSVPQARPTEPGAR